MTMHRINFSYSVPEEATLEVEMDAYLDLLEKEEIAFEEIRDQYPDIHNIQIEEIVQV